MLQRRRFGFDDNNRSMATFRDEALVLRTHKLGEADRIITLLSRRHGKIRAVAKGVRRTSSKIGGRLEPFSHVDAQFATGRSLDIVTQVDTLHAYDAPLRSNYEAYAAGNAMVEIADKIAAEEGEPALSQYRLLLGALRTLGYGTPDGPRHPLVIMTSYLMRAMAIAGYAPALTACAQCGDVGDHPWFSAEGGGMLCSGCRHPRSVMPSEQSWPLMRALLSGDWPATADCSRAVVVEVTRLVASFVSWHLGHELRSLPMAVQATG